MKTAYHFEENLSIIKMTMLSSLCNGSGVTSPVLSSTNGGTTTKHTPGISERTGSTTTFNYSGLKNNELQTAGSNQTVNASKDYDAFGNQSASSGTWSGSFQYGGPYGYQTDSDTNLKLLGHRYDDPTIGRFLTRDPIKSGRNWNAYCRNNPVTCADPSGLLTTIGCMVITDHIIRSEWWPPMPEGESVDKNIRWILKEKSEIAKLSDDVWMNRDIGKILILKEMVLLNEWADRVRTDGIWDYKKYHPNPEMFDDAGNFDYGATGGALGFDLAILLLAGDSDAIVKEQLIDQLDDKYWIMQGFLYYQEFYEQ